MYLRTAISVGQEGWANFELREDARLPLGHLPRRPRARPAHRASATTSGEPVWQEVPGEYRGRPAPPARRAGRHRAGVGRAAAPSVPDRAEPLRPAQPVPGQRRGGPSPVGDGVPAAPLLRPRRPRRGRRAARAPLGRPRPTRASSARSTSRRPTGCRSSSSPTSPTATASTSWRRCGRAGSTRCRARASSCSRRRRTTCSSAPPASAASCSAPSS